MKVIIAPDSFKGSLSSIQAAEAIERGIKKAALAYSENVEVAKVPMADGGEGTVEAIISAVGGKIIPTKALDPLGRPIDSFFGVLPDNTAVIEMAAASGLNFLKEEERNPLKTTSYGTGQLIKAALDMGCENIIIGIGGSATNDGGVGMAQAIGVEFLDKEGKQIGFGGGELSKIYKIDISNLDGRVKNAKFTIASDVKNPLCGPEGASAIYGPQKGATPEMIEILDKNLDHLAKIIKRDLGKDIKDLPGAGAAGGLGAALMAFLGAEFRLGIDLIIELVKLEDKMAESDIVVTGEGMTDYQTLYGKVPLGIARVAKKHNKPVICISGSLGEGYEELYYNGIEALFSIVNRPMSLEEAVKRGEGLLEKITINVFKTYLM
ncbi:glycerate kinase [Tepidanaerobacter syntrophicus]|uniref:glycerate kinase n=2 Tax=Tepidanaerobacter syntrophicus TaxID=224999 RepID=UPI001BD62CEE|nr:glycerate kinase [Tepidanaerobacter syntrophicus]